MKLYILKIRNHQGDWIDDYKKIYTETWLRDNKTHRVGGPALLFSDGYSSWFRNGLRHREDGPAEFWSYNYEDEVVENYYLEGVSLEKKYYNKILKSEELRAKYKVVW